jgi:hypothetical protein
VHAKPIGRPFKSGAEWNGNRAGRPKGSRDALCHDYVAALQKVWAEGGEKALHKLLKEKPAEIVRAVGQLVPKEFDLGNDTAGGLRALTAAMERVAAQIATEDE